MKKKRSSEIKLFLISTVTVLAIGCDNSAEYIYPTKEDCTADWGEEDCNYNVSRSYTGGGTGLRGYYSHRGPYDSSHFNGRHATSIIRGGFGHSAGRFGGG